MAVSIALVAVIAIILPHRHASVVRDIRLESGLPKTMGQIPFGFWANKDHFVCCWEGMPSDNPAIIRRCIVYDIRTNRHWHLPALEGNLHWPWSGSDLPWDFIGLSTDRRHILVEGWETWATAEMPNVSDLRQRSPLHWTKLPQIGPSQAMGTSRLIAFIPTPSGVPLLDRFEEGAHGIAAISPDGRRLASVGEVWSSGRGTKPDYTLWIADAGSKYSRCVATFGGPDLSQLEPDVRWSPDGKHISCVKYICHSDGSWEYRLTIFDVD